jgi:ABC-2 type transport system permease protein
MISRLIWTEIKLLTREPLTLLMSLLVPILLMVLLVASFGSDPDPAFGPVSGADFYVPVYVAAIVAVMGFLGLPTHLAAYRESGVLRRFRAAGIPGWVVVTAQAVVMALVVLVGTAVMLALGLGLYGLSRPDAPLGVAVGVAVGTVAFAAIGALLGSLLPTSRTAQGLGLALFFGLFFIAGGGPPPSLLPDAVNTAADLTPMGLLIDAVSGPWYGSGWDGIALVVLAMIAAVTAAMAGWRLSLSD